MNKLFLLLFFATIHSDGQIINGKTSSIRVDTTKNPESDTTLRVVFADNKKPERQPVIFINGKFVMTAPLLISLDPKKIDDIKVVKGDTLINNIKYYGQIHIITKSNYN